MAGKHFIQLMAEEAPAARKAFFDLADTLKNDCGLEEKTFQLIYIAIKASMGEAGSVSAHSGYAKKAGATREEVIGAVLVTLMTHGITGVSACLDAAIDAYDKE